MRSAAAGRSLRLCRKQSAGAPAALQYTTSCGLPGSPPCGRRTAAHPGWCAAERFKASRSFSYGPSVANNKDVMQRDGAGPEQSQAHQSSLAMAPSMAAMPPSIPFNLTDIGEGITEVELVQWFVRAGDTVRQFDKICEVQSDKATVEISSRYDGVVQKIHWSPGDMVQTGSALVDIAPKAKAEVLSTQKAGTPALTVPAKTAAESSAVVASTPPVVATKVRVAAPGPVLTTPAVRKLAREHGIDLSSGCVTPTGPHGRLLKSDVLDFIRGSSGGGAGGGGHKPSLPAAPALDTVLAREMNVAAAEVHVSPKTLSPPTPAPVWAASPGAATTVVGGTAAAEDIWPELPRPAGREGPPLGGPLLPEGMRAPPRAAKHAPGEKVPIRGIQRAMLETMSRSLDVPHMVFMDDVVMDKLVVLRQDLKATAEKHWGIKLSYLPLIIKATSLALKKYPLLNSSISGCQKEIHYHTNHNIGVAMDTPKGLLVPSIKHCQERSVFEIAKELARMQQLGADGKLGEEDLSGGTFTLSNIGTIGGTYCSPVILYPQVCIGALGKMKVVPCFDSNGLVVPQRLMPISWSADHRIIDGGTLARFSNLWKDHLENPAGMLGETR